MSVVAVGLVVCAGCAGERSNVRFGSLTPAHRTLDYKPGVNAWVLANKLTVAVIPDDRVNLVSVDVRYTVGDAEDPPGKAGLAHLVEHLMFERKSQDGRGKLWDRIEQASLAHNATTSADHTHYYAIGLADKLDDLLAIDLERMASGCKGIDQATLDHERALVIDEIGQKHLDDVARLHGALFGPHHPYGAFSSSRDVASITLDDVCRFIDAHYAPDRAILVVSGRVARPVVPAILNRFGVIRRRAAGARTPIAPLRWTGEDRTLVTDLVDRPSVLITFPDAPWESKPWIYDQMMWILVEDALRRDLPRSDWMIRFDRLHLGGERAGTTGVVIEVKSADDAERAVAEVLTAIHGLHTSLGDNNWIAAANRRQSELLQDLESIHDRGFLTASYLQFTTHGKLQLYELAELQHVDRSLLHERAEVHTRDASRIVRLIPPPDHDHPHHLVLTGALAEIDSPGAELAVDASEADRPLAFAQEAQPSAIRERQLANGLRVVMLANARQPVFEARLVFPVGISAPRDRKRGVSELVPALLRHDWESKHTLTGKEQDAVDWVVRIASPVARRVGPTQTTFSISGFSLFADAELWRLHWLLANGIFDRVELDHYRDLIARDERNHDEGRVRAQAISRALFGADHPFAIDNSYAARVAAVNAITKDDLTAFRDAFYRARGATLILVGNFDPDAMDKQVDELFGAWSAAPGPAAPALPAMRPPSEPTWLTLRDPLDDQVHVTFEFPATSPRATTRGARAILAQLVRARVNQIRERFGASYGVSASYSSTTAGDYVEIDGELDAARAGDAIRQLQAYLDGLRAGDAALAREFVLARRHALTAALADPLRSRVAADHLERAIVLGLPVDVARTLPAEIAATTLADVRAVIAQDLDAAHLVAMVSGQSADVARALAEAKPR